MGKLNKLRDQIYQDALEHGLWDPDATPMDAAQLVRSEAMELIYSVDDKRIGSGFCEELADVIIMCLSVAGRYGIDIDQEVRMKMDINKKRPWRHGKE